MALALLAHLAEHILSDTWYMCGPIYLDGVCCFRIHRVLYANPKCSSAAHAISYKHL